jgi:hypothetical protein
VGQERQLLGVVSPIGGGGGSHVQVAEVRAFVPSSHVQAALELDFSKQQEAAGCRSISKSTMSAFAPAHSNGNADVRPCRQVAALPYSQATAVLVAGKQRQYDQVGSSSATMHVGNSATMQADGQHCDHADRQATALPSRQTGRQQCDHAGRQAAMRSCRHTGRQAAAAVQPCRHTGRQQCDHAGRLAARPGRQSGRQQQCDQAGRQAADCSSATKQAPQGG